MTKLWFGAALIEGEWRDEVRLTIADGRIASIESGVAADGADERHAIGVPGLANVHSHAFQRGMAGLAEQGSHRGDDFWSWRQLMYRFLDRLDPDDVEAIAAQAYAEMLEGGFTRVGEFHYLHHASDGTRYTDPAEMALRIAAAADATGIALTLLPVFYAHADFGAVAPLVGQRRFVTDLDAFARLNDASAKAALALPAGRAGIAPHSLRAVTPDELAALIALAPECIHIHAAEQQKEVDASIAFSGARPVEWLLDHADIGARWTLIHATHMTDAETDRLAASGATVGLCPLTEANLGDGLFPMLRYASAGGRFAIGTDSNILIDPAQELRTIEYAQRLAHERRALMHGPSPSVGATLFAGAAAGGACALGGGAGLAVGEAADIVALDACHPALVARKGDMLLDGWIFASRGGAVDAVWRHGRRVVSDGRHHDAAPIARRYAATMAKLLA